MGHRTGPSPLELRLFRTLDHECGYFPGRVAQDLVIDPNDPWLGERFRHALGWGFRRSGNLVYRPDCVACHACRPVRIPVEGFVPNRAQRRCLKRNAGVDIRICPAERTDEQFALYRRYLSTRHEAGGMDGHNELDFDQFLTSEWTDTKFLEMRENGRLIGVAVTDFVADALSAVYTFFDPEFSARSLGTYGILKQIEHARDHGLTHAYLGYWIENHPKMHYKRNFHGVETLFGRHWIPLAQAEAQQDVGGEGT